MSFEHGIRTKVVELLAVLHAVPVENSVQQGTPDVNCSVGWIEIKYVPQWPARGGPVRVEHFTTQQRWWLKQRRLARGSCWLLLRVANDWLLLRGCWAADHLGTATREELETGARCVWRGTAPRNTELVGALLQDHGQQRLGA